MVLRVWVVVPPVFAAEANDRFSRENWQIYAFYKLFRYSMDTKKYSLNTNMSLLTVAHAAAAPLNAFGKLLNRNREPIDRRNCQTIDEAISAANLSFGGFRGWARIR